MRYLLGFILIAVILLLSLFHFFSDEIAVVLIFLGLALIGTPKES